MKIPSLPPYQALGLDHDFESPIERDLANAISKYLADGVKLRNQVEISTPHGNFRCDFVVIGENRSIVLEADGREFHQRRRYEDLFRDAAIVLHSEVRAVYRIPGKVISFGVYDGLFLLSSIEKDLFSERGKENLKTLSVLSRKPDQIKCTHKRVEARPPATEEDPRPMPILFDYLSPFDPMWAAYVDFLTDNNDCHADEVAEKWRRQGLSAHDQGWM